MDSNDKPCCVPGSGCCSGKTVNRRDFIKSAVVASGAVGFLQSGATPDAIAAIPDPKDAFNAWKKSLFDTGSMRVYRGEELKNIGMPMGGFGAGQVYVRGNGSLGPWQILNNFNSNAFAPGGFFGLWTRDASGKVVAKVLQEGALQDCPGVESIEFSGEYPFAWLKYNDQTLPVTVKLETYSPLIPLNSKDSSLPAVVFGFEIENTSQQPIDVSLLASAPNLVGWDGYGKLDSLSHDEFIGNRTVFTRDGSTSRLVLDVPETGAGHRLSEPRELYVNSRTIAHHLRMCENVSLHWGDPIRTESKGRAAVYWLGGISGKDNGAQVLTAIEVAKKGAVLILSGGETSLISAVDKGKTESEVEVFDDFESGTFSKWTQEGNCFGPSPVEGTLPGQQKVSGFQGKALVNSYFNGDDAQGRAVSAPFELKMKFVHLLVGGGQWPGETCINLIAEGKVLETATGENTEALRSVRWDVSEHVGKTVQFEILDKRTGGWGHILVDHILLSESAASPFLDPKVPEALADVLPITWKRKSFVKDAVQFDSESPVAKASGLTGPVRGHWTFKSFRKKRHAKVLLKTDKGAPLIVSQKLGEGTIVVCLGDPAAWFENANRKIVLGQILAASTGLMYENLTGWSPQSPVYGSMALMANASTTTAAEWTELKPFWDGFAAKGQLEHLPHSASPGKTVAGALSVSERIQPGEKKRIDIVLSWHFPNRTRDNHYWWILEQVRLDFRLGNMYNNWFKSAIEAGNYVLQNLPRLENETRLFHDTFYDSTLPRYLLDCVSANLSITRCPIYIWLEDGTVGGFEGSDSCCPLNCTHVYNYAMSTAFILPEMERKVRELDLLVQMHPEEHYIPHRLLVPLSEPRIGRMIGGPEHPALDGELGTILKTYREWRQMGERKWLEKLWPRLKTLMEYIMREHDPDGDGVIRGEQPNTYDTHLYGSNTFIGTLYLAALRATEEMAKVFNDDTFAQTCHQRFESGRVNYDKTCWNGEFYINVFDAPDVKPDVYNQNNCYGPGCFSDQLLGQWWANLLELGHVLPQDHVRQALKATFHYNWKDDLSNHRHSQRVFAEGNEKGLLTGSWPKGGRPEKPILYCDEVWTGLEYHVAASMLHEGMIEDALCVIRGARDRYTGNQRNPWSEIECGGHYARAMSSYSLLPAAAGLDYHAGHKSLHFNPRLSPEKFMSFFVAANGWGTLVQDRFGNRQRNIVSVKHGELALNLLVVTVPEGVATPGGEVSLGRVPVKSAMTYADGRISFVFPDGLAIAKDEALSVVTHW
jgi:uncharacterized protein (DUF608 family)